MEPALSCSHISSKFCHCLCHTKLRVETDSSETHVADHNRGVELKIWSKLCFELYVTTFSLSKLEFGWFLSNVSPEFHWFSQGVNARVCNLAGIKEKAVIDNWQIPGISHS